MFSPTLNNPIGTNSVKIVKEKEGSFLRASGTSHEPWKPLHKPAEGDSLFLFPLKNSAVWVTRNEGTLVVTISLKDK